MLQSDAVGLDEDDNNDYDKHLTMYISMYGEEDIHTGNVLKTVLNANSTVRVIMRYAKRILSEARERRDAETGAGAVLTTMHCLHLTYPPTARSWTILARA